MNATRLWLALMIVASGSGRAQHAVERDGVFSGPYWWPVIGIHTVQLPNGEILHYSYPHQGMDAHGVGSAGCVFDPVLKTLREVDCQRNIFCSGHSILPDGQVLVTGGTFSHNPERGLPDTHLFDPVAHTWNRIEEMQHGRYYPTNVTLGDGRVLVLGGVDEDGAINTQIEIFDPGSGWSVIPWANKALELYPRCHLLTSGLVAVVGPDQDTETFDPVSGRWAHVTRMLHPNRFEGCSFLVPLREDRVMLVGGFGGGTGSTTDTTEVIDFGDPAPAWRPGPSNAYPRVFGNVVILADATVLYLGGQRVLNHPLTAVLPAELYDPISDTWRTVASLRWPRLYHSSAGLLLDGRVIVAGGDNVQNVEFYSPPYLFRERPKITDAPATIAHGGSFIVEVDPGAAGRIRRVALLRLGGMTHSVAMDQRHVTLDFHGAAGDRRLAVRAPASANAAPAGHYMLVVVAENGAPSVARVVRLL